MMGVAPHILVVDDEPDIRELIRTYLAQEGYRVLSRDRLLALTRHREAGPFDRSIDVQVGRLRRKIESDPERPVLIKSVRAAGYVFTSPVAHDRKS